GSWSLVPRSSGTCSIHEAVVVPRSRTEQHSGGAGIADMRKRGSISLTLWTAIALAGCGARPAPRGGDSPPDEPDAGGASPDVAPSPDAAARPMSDGAA